MTSSQKSIVGAALVAAFGIAAYQTWQVARLHEQLQSLQRGREQEIALTNELRAVQQERDRATNALAAVSAEIAAIKKNPSEVLKLRGEVGRLREEKAELGATSAVSKITANPESRKMLHDQQKLGMAMIYKSLAKDLKLSTEQTDKFNDLLAEHIMHNVDNVTTVLRDKSTPDQMNALFAAQDATLQQQLQTLLGEDGAAKYQDYTRNILSTLSAEQFKGMMTGSDDEKNRKADQFRKVLQDATQAALASAGLPPDFQAVPILNFRNIASEQDADQNLKLLTDIYQRAAANANGILTPDDLAKFQEFTGIAYTNSRNALNLNRTLMAPLGN